MGRPARLSETEVTERLATAPQWTRSGDTLTRTFTFKGFPEAVAFVDRIVAPAEAADHHPDLDVRYNRVIVSLSTHSAGGLTRLDFELAETIARLQP